MNREIWYVFGVLALTVLLFVTDWLRADLVAAAITVAEAMGADPCPFAIAVLVGASASFLLPTGHLAPMLVQGPGVYRTGDYARFGLGLAVLTPAAIALIIPILWPLQGQ